MARVLNIDDLSDAVLRSKCAVVFMFFLPGLSTMFPEIALEDLKVGHAIPMVNILFFIQTNFDLSTFLLNIF